MRRWPSEFLPANRGRRVGIRLSSPGLEMSITLPGFDRTRHKLKAAKDVTTFSYKDRRYSRSYPALDEAQIGKVSGFAGLPLSSAFKIVLMPSRASTPCGGTADLDDCHIFTRRQAHFRQSVAGDEVRGGAEAADRDGPPLSCPAFLFRSTHQIVIKRGDDDDQSGVRPRHSGMEHGRSCQLGDRRVSRNQRYHRGRAVGKNTS
jgi:hypothetical protein